MSTMLQAARPPRRPFGQWGKRIDLFDAWEEWAENGQAQLAGLQEAADQGDWDAQLALEETDTRFDFPNYLFGPINTSLWHSYTTVSPQYRRYAAIESLPDLRERRLRGLNAVRGMSYVGENGEYPEGRRTERPSIGLMVDKYGYVYKITMEAIINDESGELLNRIPGEMGRDAAIFVANTIVALIESNPLAADGVQFFHSSRGNTGVAPLSEDSLADGISYFDSMVDDSGYPIVIEPGALIVRNTRLQMIAKRIINSTLTGVSVTYSGAAGAGAAIFDKGTINPLDGILPNDGVVKERFMSDPNDWYLFANPSQVPAFAIGFLNAQETPFVGLKEPAVRSAMGAGVDPYTFEFDSIDFKVRHFFGVAAVDPRGAFRSVVP
jgi:hypothetical protein